MENKVIQFIKQKGLIKQNTKVLVGVSGGPDSMALLYFLHRLKSFFQIELTAIALDHQLRGVESEQDIVYVKQHCERLNIPLISRTLPVAAYQKDYQVGTQVAARTLRYRVYAEEMETNKINYLALGHHADDQIETILMALVRTATTKHLTGIPVQRPFASGQIIRPFLCVTKAEIEHYCAEHELYPRIDSSNFGDDYTRNRMRHHVIPLLKNENPNLAETIQNLTESTREDHLFLQQLANKAFGKVAKIDPKAKAVSLSITSLFDYPVPLQRRIFRLTLDYLYDHAPPVSHQHETALLLLFQKYGNKRLDFPNGLIVEKSYEQVNFFFDLNKKIAPPFHAQIEEVPASLFLPNGALLTIYTSTSVSPEKIANKNTYVCLRNDVEFPLTIRTREPGDRMQFEGLNGTKKIKDIFIDEKVPLNDRAVWSMVLDGHGEILWLIGLKKRQHQRLEKENEYLVFEYSKK